MAKIEVAPDLIEIFEHVADKLKLPTYPNNTVDDFKRDDIVQCTLLHGLYRVEDISSRVWIVSLNDSNCDNILQMKPKYLKKLDKNSKAFKTLFTRT